LDLLISPHGIVSTIYSEEIDLTAIGRTTIRRASHVEPTSDGMWTADLSPVGGPVLGPFARRSDALAAEVNWLEPHLRQLTGS
jgi:hypothetical protein